MKNLSDHNIIAYCLIIIAMCMVINTINVFYQQSKANDLISKIEFDQVKAPMSRNDRGYPEPVKIDTSGPRGKIKLQGIGR